MSAMKNKALLFGIGLTLFFCLVGELFRFKGVLLLDLWVPLFVAGALLWELVLSAQKGTLPLKKQLKPLIPHLFLALCFLIIGTSSLLINSQEMSNGQVLQSLFYGIRWASLFGLSLIVSQQNSSFKKQVLWLLFGFATLLAIAGFVQLKIAPDFGIYERLGWDPHKNRLLSTWFDPNFTGGFLAFALALLAGQFFKEKKHRPILIALGGIILAALVLTLSRSSYLAFLASMIVFSLFHSKKLLLGLALLLVPVLLFVQPVQDRVLDLQDGLDSLIGESYVLPDPSARHRISAYQEGWALFADKPVLGQGYNRYKYAAIELGLIKDPNVHASSGTDSSLLTILATTGILGFIPFFSLYLLLAFQAFKDRKNTMSLGFLAGLCGLFVHALFVNSLLFPLFMAPFWLATGLVPHLRFSRN